MRIVTLLVGAWLVLAARPADACGRWEMTDVEKQRTVSFLINSAEILTPKRRIGAFYLDIESKHPMRAVRGRKVVFDIKDNKLRKHGKPVATLDGNTITFGKKTYTIELTDPHMFRGALPAWKLAVTRDGKLIVESEDASSLCAGMGKPSKPVDHEDEVRRRVIYYLAWRELGGS